MVLKNKKGVVFSLIAIAISIILISSFYYYHEVPIDNNIEVTRLAIQNNNNFISGYDDHLNKIISRVFFNALNGTINVMIAQNQYFDNFDEELIRCMNTGNVILGGNNYSCGENSRFDIMLNEWQIFVLENTNINVTTNVSNFNFAMNSPWSLRVSYLYTATFESPYSTNKISRESSFSQSIFGLPDPTYQVQVASRVNSLNLNNTFSVGEIFDLNVGTWMEEPSTLNQLVQNKHYIRYSQGPSFLNRLRGNMIGSSSYGIVSIVRGADANFMGNISYLDYEFFKDNCISADRRRYNFWNTGINNEDRANLGIPSSAGLNGTILPFNNIINPSNTSNSAYLENVVVTCS